MLDANGSLDAGRSWNMTSIGVPGFGIPWASSGYGLGAAYKLIVTPTGRLLAQGCIAVLPAPKTWA